MKNTDFIQTPNISIIVPVYKVEKYIKNCIDSLLSQTFHDFEILIIDDGSPDNSGRICDEFAKRDFRIKVFHKENAGVSNARNLGLDNAKGKWVIFIDSDDYITNDFLETIVEDEKKNADLMIYSYSNIKENGINVSNFSHKKYFYSEKDIGLAFRFSKLSEIGYPWCKVFKTSIIQANNIRFNQKLPISEDRLFTYQYLFYTKSIYFSNKIVYNYRSFSEGSLSTAKHNTELLIYRTKVLYNELLRLKKHHNLSFIEIYPFINWHISYVLYALDSIKSNSLKNLIIEKKTIWNTLKGYPFYKEHKNDLHKSIIEIYRRVGIQRCCLIHHCFTLYLIKTIIKYIRDKYFSTLFCNK